MRTALIISTYNWPHALQKILQSVGQQTVLPHEVIIADDGSDERTREVIEAFRMQSKIPLQHFWHADQGFRKTMIMNMAIASSMAEYIIQIDGDIILHPDFIKDHISEAESGYYIKGSRVLLLKELTHCILTKERIPHITALTKGIKNRINAIRSSFLAAVFMKRNKRSDNLRGCNCAFWKNDFIAVNGYNNDLKGWGHEDIELAARFINLGLQQKSLKHKAVCYHLDHPYYAREHMQLNYEVYEKVIASGQKRCDNGCEQE